MTNGIADELELLFDEVCGLAACLRDAARRSPGGPHLSLAGHGALRVLEVEGALTVPQLARLRGTSRQNMQVLVDRLAHHGWIEYVVNPDHQRSERVRLTGPGEQTLRSTNQRHATRLAALLPHVSERSLRTCIGQLQRLHRLLLAEAGRRPRPDLIARERRSAGSRAGRAQSPAGEASSASGRLRSKVTRAWTQDTTAPVSPEEVRPTEETVGVETLPVTLL